MDMSVFASENIENIGEAEVVEVIDAPVETSVEENPEAETDPETEADLSAGTEKEVEIEIETDTKAETKVDTKANTKSKEQHVDDAGNDIIEIDASEEIDVEEINEYESETETANSDSKEAAKKGVSENTTQKKKGKRIYNAKLSGDVRARIVQYANSLGGFFESPYVRSGMSLAWQCCAYVNQVWWDVFGVDLYAISDSSKNTFSYDGETAYEFFERVGVKSGDVIYTRYQKIKKNKRGGIMRDKNGVPVKTMGQHFVIILDYDEENVWYTDGYESRTRGFVISSIDKKVKYSDSKYFRNVGGAYADIDNAYYAKAGKRGCRFRYYRLPEYIWQRAGGDSDNTKTEKAAKDRNENRLKSMATLSATESTEVMGGVGNLWISGIDEDGYEYNGEEITPAVKLYDNFRLVDEEDYVVEYSDNVNAGNATVWVSRITEPMGTISANFVIKPYDLEAHFNSENEEESDINVKMPSVVKDGDFDKLKPLVTCNLFLENENGATELSDDENTISENTISENAISENSNSFEIPKTKIERLKNNKSCVFTYPDSAEFQDGKLTIYIEGIGNFTGKIAVTSDVTLTGMNTEEKMEKTKERRALSRKEEIHRRLHEKR